MSVYVFISNGRDTVNVNKQMDDCKRGFVGVSAIFRCCDRSSAQRCEHQIPAVAPNPSCAHATAATPVVEEPSRDQVEERGDAERRE